ncbi:MAG: N-acetyltransferase [Gemmiger sp.]|nr:N-acetyltransferase [Gemmiger sp.]
MEYIRVTKENIENESICCAISNDKDIQVSSKKAWLMNRFADGLVFLKSTQRGKCFIEYIPAENAWVPIWADGYLYIDCFWVSGSLKGHGYANDLLNACMADAKANGKIGLCILSSAKKKPFLSDPKHLLHKGFQLADVSDTGIQLMYLPFEQNAPVPKFKACAKHPHIEESGYVLYYTNQCPFNGKYVPIVEETAREHAIPFKAIRLETKEQAQAAPTPCTTYALFYNGTWLTNEQLNDKRFLKLVENS